MKTLKYVNRGILTAISIISGLAIGAGSTSIVGVMVGLMLPIFAIATAILA